MNGSDIYAKPKRRKPVPKSVKPSPAGDKSNPSKRHRDRVNEELEKMASLLPFPDDVISTLDKITVLRLGVSYLRTKSFFNVALESRSCKRAGADGPKTLGKENLEGELLLQVLNGFLLVVTVDGSIFYASSTIKDYLGFHQSDVVYQSVYELVHTEDRFEFQRQLHWALSPDLSAEASVGNQAQGSSSLPLTYYSPVHLPPENSTFLERNFVCRLRCLLDHSSGFLAMNIQGRLKFLHGQNHKAEDGSLVPPQLALFALAKPLQPASILEIHMRSFIFRTKHKLDFTPIACDPRGKLVLGYSDSELRERGTGYQFLHAADMLYCADNHMRMMKTGKSGLTVFRLLNKQRHWVWVQANARLIYKNGRPDHIIASQKVITDEEGEDNLRKRNLRLPFDFTTGEAVLYDIGILKSLSDPTMGRATTAGPGGSASSNDVESVDPSSLLCTMMKQDDSIYVCEPAQSQTCSVINGELTDTMDDRGRDLSSDQQVTDLGFLGNAHVVEDKNRDLLNFMTSLGICKEDLKLFEKDEGFLQGYVLENCDIMEAADEILSHVGDTHDTHLQPCLPVQQNDLCDQMDFLTNQPPCEVQQEQQQLYRSFTHAQVSDEDPCALQTAWLPSFYPEQNGVQHQATSHQCFSDVCSHLGVHENQSGLASVSHAQSTSLDLPPPRLVEPPTVAADTLDLEELLESLDSGFGERACVTGQRGSDAAVVSAYENVSRSLPPCPGDSQRVNPFVLEPVHQQSHVQVQNDDVGHMNLFYPDSSSLANFQQPEHPLHQGPSRTLLYPDLTLGGFTRA